jgi:pimeloyl-ACP methyl ester carboxylesterase
MIVSLPRFAGHFFQSWPFLENKSGTTDCCWRDQDARACKRGRVRAALAAASQHWQQGQRAYDAHDVGTTPGFGGDTAAALRSIRARTLLLVPELDLYNPIGDAVEAATLIPNATLVHLPGNAGHAVAADTSPQLADIRAAIDGFLHKLAV